MLLLRSLLSCLLALCAAAAGAAVTAAPPPPSPAASAAAPAASSAASRVQVVDDKNVRIEETRIRGQLQRVTVQSKLPGAKPYEIIVGPGGRDPSQDHGAEGQRAWSVFDF